MLHFRRGASEIKKYIDGEEQAKWKHDNNDDQFSTEHRRIYKRLPNIASTEQLLGSGASQASTLSNNAFFSAANRKIFDIYGTENLQKKRELSSIGEDQDHMRTLRQLNQQKKDLDDTDKYYIAPSRYASKENQWRLIKKKSINPEENQVTT